MDKQGAKIIFIWLIGGLFLFSQHFEGKVFLGDEAGIELVRVSEEFRYSFKNSLYNLFRPNDFTYTYPLAEGNSGTFKMTFSACLINGFWIDKTLLKLLKSEKLALSAGLGITLRTYFDQNIFTYAINHRSFLILRTRLEAAYRLSDRISLYSEIVASSLNYLLKEWQESTPLHGGTTIVGSDNVEWWRILYSNRQGQLFFQVGIKYKLKKL